MMGGQYKNKPLFLTLLTFLCKYLTCGLFRRELGHLRASARQEPLPGRGLVHESIRETTIQHNKSRSGSSICPVFCHHHLLRQTGQLTALHTPPPSPPLSLHLPALPRSLKYVRRSVEDTEVRVIWTWYVSHCAIFNRPSSLPERSRPFPFIILLLTSRFSGV